MTLATFLILVAALFIFLSINNKIKEKKKKSAEILHKQNIHNNSTNQPTATVTKEQIQTNFYIPGRLTTDSVDTGKMKIVKDGVYCMNPNSPLPLSFTNISTAIAQKLKTLLDEDSSSERKTSEITFLIAQYNIECVELSEFMANAKKKVSELIEQQKTSSNEWVSASKKDKADLLIEFQNNARKKLDTKPASDFNFKKLLFKSEKNNMVDDNLLKKFSGNENLFKFYVYNLEYKRAHRVSAEDYSRKDWETLVKLGLAQRGRDIPVKVLFETLRMKDINEFFSDRLEKKLSRKAQAVEFAESQADALDVLSNHVSFREMFQIIEPIGIDVSEIKECYEFANSQTKIICATYRTGCDTLSAIDDNRDCKFDGWEIEAEDCCNSCSKLHGKKTKTKPSKLPPFHIGCTCSVEEVFND